MIVGLLEAFGTIGDLTAYGGCQTNEDVTAFLGEVFGMLSRAKQILLSHFFAPVQWTGIDAMNVFTWIVIGAVLGAAIAAIIAKEFKWRAPNAKTLLKQFMGGGLMGFGAAVAGGCNIGHGLSGVPMLSIGSIVTFGCIAGGIILVSYFLFMRD